MATVLTEQNYYDPEMNMEYMSCSQFKEFADCEARAMARLRGWKEPTSKEFLVGSYVHAWAEGALDCFKAEHPEIISTRGDSKGQLKAEFVSADIMIQTLMADPVCMKYSSLNRNTAMTAMRFGSNSLRQ